MNGHISPLLGLRFALDSGELMVFDRTDRPLRSPAEMASERDAERNRAEKLAAKLRELGVDPDKV